MGTQQSVVVKRLTFRLGMACLLALAVCALAAPRASAEALPDVVGMEESAGLADLAAAGVTVTEVRRACNSAMASGMIVSQTLLDAEALTAEIVVSSGPCQVTVPNLVGMTEAAAGTALEAVALNVGTVVSVCNDLVAAGLILSQDPASGARVDPCSGISLVLSSGPCPEGEPPVEGEGEAPEFRTVPNVVGQSESDARAAITAVQLTPSVSYENSTTVAQGRVIRQNPTGGTQALINSVVTMVVSLGPPPAEGETPELRTVPNVVGQTESDARAAITAVQLQPSVAYEYSTVVAQGRVIRQSPAGGAQVNVNSTVNLVVSAGPPPAQVTVPDVVGQPELTASAAIVAAQLVPNVTYEYSTVVAEGVVIRQNPVGGTQATANSTVNLVVSAGPPPPQVTVPDVVGQSETNARAAIVAVQLTPSVAYEYSTTVAQGIVMRQSPAGGAQANRFSTVNLVVSAGPPTTPPPAEGETPDPTIPAPGALGMTGDEARTALENAGFNVQIEERRAPGCAKVPAGTVLGQSPEAGASVMPGSTITVYVARDTSSGGCGGSGSLGDVILGLFSALGLYLFSCIWGCPEPPGLS